MKTILRLIAFSFLFTSSFIMSPAFSVDMTSAVGNWATIDDETGKQKSVVSIIQTGNTLTGKIIRLTDPKKKNAVCDLCKGKKKNQRIIGLEMLWGLKKAKGGWSGGSILDPSNGKVYKATLALADGGKKLNVRGYIGIPLFGRSQTWIRQ